MRLIRITLRTDRKQVQRAGCGAFFIRKELFAACCRRSIGALQHAAVNFPGIQRAIQNPYIGGVIQFQDATGRIRSSGTGRSIIGSIQITAIHALDVITACGFFQEPTNRVTRDIIGIKSLTGKTGVDVCPVIVGELICGRIDTQSIATDSNDICRVGAGTGRYRNGSRTGNAGVCRRRSGNHCSTFSDASDLAIFINSCYSCIAAAPGNVLIGRILRRNLRGQLHGLSGFDRFLGRRDRNTGHSDRILRLINRDFIRIAFRAHREQVR